MSHYKWTMLGLNLLLVVAQILIIAGLARGGHFDYIISIIVTTSLWGVYMFLEARYRLYMNNYVRAVVVLSLVGDAFLGYYLNLYVTSSIADKLLHVFGTYAFSLFAYILVVQLLTNPVKRSFKIILVICLGLSIGTVYEILEFFTDTISHPVPPSQPSLLDTDLDLIGDAIGALFAAIHATSRKFIDQNF